MSGLYININLRPEFIKKYDNKVIKIVFKNSSCKKTMKLRINFDNDNSKLVGMCLKHLIYNDKDIKINNLDFNDMDDYAITKIKVGDKKYNIYDFMTECFEYESVKKGNKKKVNKK